MRDVESIVVNNLEVARNTYLLSVECSMEPSEPGQFVMVRVSRNMEPFLRRPLAILKHSNNILELLYKVIGTGTEILSQKKPGDTLSILGPLGRGFSMPMDNEEVIYAAGGTGLPPIVALAEQVKRGCLIIGAKTIHDIPLLERLKNLTSIRIETATEDGSYGQRGLVTDILDSVVTSVIYPLAIYACGPSGMLKSIKIVAERLGARCEISLEERMACGFGVCSGCVVNTRSGNRRVCREGPVFNAMDVIF